MTEPVLRLSEVTFRRDAQILDGISPDSAARSDVTSAATAQIIEASTVREHAAGFLCGRDLSDQRHGPGPR
jgi:hypothetical protein